MEKIGEIIKDYKEDIEIFDENWINIRIIVDKTKEILENDYEIKEMNWNNFTIIYKNNEFYIERIASPDGSSKYLIKKYNIC
jgi:hypothetical protein